MSESTNLQAAVDEAAVVLRGLARIVAADATPKDAYPVIGGMLSSARSLIEIVDQLSGILAHAQPLARDERDSAAGGAVAVGRAIDALQRAAGFVDQFDTALDEASQAAGTIVWNTPDVPGPGSERWVSVVFLQGEDADRVLDMINQQGSYRALEELMGYDYGAETDGAARENGYVYDTPPAGQLDRSMTQDGYTLTYNTSFGYVGLYRHGLDRDLPTMQTPRAPEIRPTRAPTAAPPATHPHAAPMSRASAARSGGPSL